MKKEIPSAYADLMNNLIEGEKVEAIVFGVWGWGSTPKEGEAWQPGYEEPEGPPVPFSLRGKVLTLKEAKPYMDGWSFYGEYGAPSCYATWIWTNERVIWVTQYDGSTLLDSAPRNPTEEMPYMPGG